MEWSGRKMMSPASGARETVPILGASGVVRCLHLSATKHKWRLGEAGQGCIQISEYVGAVDRKTLRFVGVDRISQKMFTWTVGNKSNEKNQKPFVPHFRFIGFR
jgi:hypothetical protein